MKKIIVILFLFNLAGTISAQRNEISMDFSFFENGNFNSGLGLNYFYQLGSKNAIGIRQAITFNDQANLGNQRTWQTDLLGRTQIKGFNNFNANIDLGLAFLNTHERLYEALRPDQSILSFVDIPVNYLGFSFGLSVDKIIFENVKIGLYHRSSLFFPIKEETEKSFIFKSRPNLFISCIF